MMVVLGKGEGRKGQHVLSASRVEGAPKNFPPGKKCYAKIFCWDHAR